jgi:error-prone DNA polymerase
VPSRPGRSPSTSPPRAATAPTDRARLAELDALGCDAGAPIVAVQDLLYHTPDRRPLQDVLTCIREKVAITEAGPLLEADAERHPKPRRELARLFKGFEPALARTLEVASAVRFDLGDLRYEYPDEPVPPGRTAQEYLEDLVWRAAALRLCGDDLGKVRPTLEKELALIARLDCARYFPHHSRHSSLRRRQRNSLPSRGSAANSAVCYVLGITAVNPVEIDLLFERFLSDERREPPDIDVDFEHERREEVIQFITGATAASGPGSAPPSSTTGRAARCARSARRSASPRTSPRRWPAPSGAGGGGASRRSR